MLYLSSGIVGTLIGICRDPLQIGMLILVFYAGAMAPRLWQALISPIGASMPFLILASYNAQKAGLEMPFQFYAFIMAAYFLPLLPGLLFRRIFRIRNDPH